MTKKISLIPGDGIGPDVVEQGVRVLDAIAKRYGHSFSYESVLAGGAALDKYNDPLPKKSLNSCLASDAVLLGAVGGPKWDGLPGCQRPELALLGLRSGMKVYANLRPALMYKELANACPLKPEIVGEGLDILIVRELTGGIYFGDSGRSGGNSGAWDTEYYSVPEIERIVRLAFKIAQKRKNRLCQVDKANILETSRLWREVSARVQKDYPNVELSYMYVDNAAMQLVRNPRQFDVIVTSNMFGDILSDEASQITGSIGMLASASLGDEGPGLFEPIHGSAPDIAGKNLANPLATILSCALLLRYGFKLENEACAVEAAVEKVLKDGWRTSDIAGTDLEKLRLGGRLAGTKEMGNLVIDALKLV